MSDSQNLGLGELGQRLQALSDPVAEPRLRPYQGAPTPAGAASNGRPAPSFESYEEFRVTPVTSSATSSASPASAAAPYTAPFTPPSPFAQPSPQQAPPPQQQESQTSWEQLSAKTSPATNPPPAQTAAEDPNAPKTGLQRAINAVRSALPVVQKLLPLLDGNFATALSALVVPQQPHHPPPAPPVDLEPLERGLADIHSSHRELRTQVQEQLTSLKRVEDQLEHVREATDRNTLEQQELLEDLRSMGSRVGLFAILGLVLLLASLGLNVWFLIQLQHILR